MPRLGTSEIVIFRDPATGFYGFRVSFPGEPPHHCVDTCKTFQDALDTCDRHREHVWEKPGDANDTKLLMSCSYQPGSVLWRMAHVERGV